MLPTEYNVVNEKLVEKILEQGQKLRNAMVQSILKNDPLNSEIIYNKHFNTPVSSTATLLDRKSSDTKLLEAFISGDYLTKDEEETALNTIRTMSVSDVCKTTEKTLLAKCSCATCSAYNTKNLKCDLRRTKNNEQCVSPYIEQKNPKYAHIIKYVDSLKVILQNIHLNNLGNKKVIHASDKKWSNLSTNETYFVEYYIPEIIAKELPKSKSKINSGLESNHVRVCARRSSEVIHVRQIFVHNVCNLYNCNLEDQNVTFFVRYKSRGQKNSELLGVAKFNLGLFETSKNFACSKTLPIHLNEDSPIIVGTLKVTLQLGCGRIYFGQEFIDAVLSQKPLSDDTDSWEEYKVVATNTKSKPLKEKSVPEKKPEKDSQYKPVNLTEQNFPLPHSSISKTTYTDKNKNEDVVTSHPVQRLDKVENLTHANEKELLLGFIYISEAQFLNVCPNSYILCKPYCQNDTSASKVVFKSTNPLYNFCQTVPLLYEDDILYKLRENFMVIEFWEKHEQSDRLFGLTRLPLHQFYLAYRNAVILQHLKRNKLPIIGTDWWEPIYSIDKNELIGQVQVLTALGTEDQIKNLELERGFRDDIVKAKFPSATHVRANVRATPSSSYFGDTPKVVNKQLKIVYNKAVNTVSSPRKSLKPRKIDVGVQSDLDVRMDAKDNSQKLPEVHNMLSSFMKLLEQRPVRMENSTNTEAAMSSISSTRIAQNIDNNPAPQVRNTTDLLDSLRTAPQVRKTTDLLDSLQTTTAPQVRKTSDLLDSLQKVLTLEDKPSKKQVKPRGFRAEILINCANQLPGRRKIKSKSKRMKGKSPKQEENFLPSTYVTFETGPGDPLHVTNVFPKSTSPQWNYKCEVDLPLDLLTNGQKRLIFKVWKKSINAVLQPNMLTDLVLGFAALDLSVLLAGLPNVQGWFNIIDFSGKCNGQINIHVNPLENLEKLCCPGKNVTDVNSSTSLSHQPLSENEDCGEVLSRALKRKFTELDEITQRLRLRLSEVVSDDSDGLNDEVAEEFENDINNICIEEDFDLVNFEDEARKIKVNCNSKNVQEQDKSSSSNILSLMDDQRPNQQSIDDQEQEVQVDEKLQSDSPDLSSEKDNAGDDTEPCSSESSFMTKHVTQGKQRIDALLEKLTLINAEVGQPFSSRYVSGCSVSNDTNDAQEIFNDLEEQSRPNIRASTSYDPLMFQHLYGGSGSLSSQSCGNLGSTLNNKGRIGCNSGSSGETSVITNFSDCRPNSDGQGANSDEKRT